MRRAVLMLVLATMVVATGCGKENLSLTRDPVARGEAALGTIRDDAGRAKVHIEKAKTGTETSAREVRSAAETALAIPQAKPFAERLTVSADRLDTEVGPERDQALARVEHVETRTEDVAPLGATVSGLQAERDRWQAEAAREKARADSAVRKWLLLVAAGGFAGILAGGALFVWLSRRAGLVVGLASLAVFAVSVALYRWFEWLAWGGLALIVLAVGGLAYGLWRNRDALRAVVLGGENVKAIFYDGVQYTREQIRDLFNRTHAATQKAAASDVEAMVRDVKSKEGM